MLKYFRIADVLILFVLMNIYASAQVLPDKDPSELSISLGGGLASIHYQEAQRAGFFNGSAIELGIGYSYYFNRNWGIFLGVAPGIYNTQKVVDMDLFNPGLVDRNNLDFDLYTNAKYNEAFQIIFLNIPVMLQYQTKEKEQTWREKLKPYQGFYVMGGIKAGIPLKDTYESKITSITNAAYYPQLNNWAATQRFAGLGTFDEGGRADGNSGLDISFRIALEAGFKWRIHDAFLLYAGTFCDIGLSNTVKEIRTPMLNNIAVDHITDFTMVTFSEKINMITAGVIVRLAFSQHPNRAHCSYTSFRENRKRNK